MLSIGRRLPEHDRLHAVRRLVVHPLDRGANERQVDAGLVVCQAGTVQRHRRPVRIVLGGRHRYAAHRCCVAAGERAEERRVD
eukprot:3600614-Prymnesium_polylepis.1